MADEYLDLSLNLDVGDAEKTAKNLKKEIEHIFNSGDKEKSSALTRLEQQMKSSYNTAEELRTALEEIGDAISRTEGYATAQREIEKTESALGHMLRTIERAEAKHPISISTALGPETFNTAEQVEKEIQTTKDAIEEARKLGYETDVLEDRLTKLQTALDAHNQAVDEATIKYNGASMTGKELKELYDSTIITIQNMRTEQEKLYGTSDVDSETALNTLRELNGAYNNLASRLDIITDKEKQQIITHREIEKREQDRVRREEERVAKEQARIEERAVREQARAEERAAKEQAKIDAERQRIHDRLEAHKQEQKIAEEQWKKAVEQEEIEARISQQHQQQIAEQRLLKEEADKAAEAERNARLEAIEANTNFMTLMMGIRSISGLIPGVATKAVSSVLSITQVLRRFKDVTWKSIKTAIMTGLSEIGAALKNIIKFILANPIVLVIAAAIAAIIVLINKLKELWDETEEQVDELFGKLEDTLVRLKDLAVDFVGVITRGFLRIGNFMPSTFLRMTQKLIDKLKSLKSLVQENIDAMAKWNDGNNDVNKALSNITSSLAYLKASITAAVAPIIVYVEPTITRLLDALGKIFEIIGMIIAKLTGATTFQRAIRKQKDYAKSLQETNNQLASFDKLNILNQDKGSAVDFDLVKLEDVDLPDWFTNFGKLAKKLSEEINGFFKKIDWNYIKEKVKGASTELANFFNNLNIGSTLGITIGEGLNTIILAINTFLNELDAVHLGEELGDIIENAIITINWNDVGEMFAGGLNKLGEFIIGLSNRVEGKEIGKAFSEFLSGSLGNIDWKIMTEAISGVVSDLVDALNAMLTPENMELVGSTLSKVFNTLICGIQLFTNSAEWTEWGTSIGAGIAEFFRDIDWKSTAIVLGNFAKGLLNLIGSAIGELLKPENLDTIINDLIDFFSNIPWDEIRQAAKEISTKLREGLSKIWEALRSSGAYDDIIKFVVEFLEEKENWDKLFAGFKSDVVADIFWGKIKGVLTAVGEAIAGAFRKLFNFLSDGISNIASFFGDFVFGDSSFSDWLNGKTPTQLNAPHMNAPQLAQGAVLPPNKPFLAMVGDQKNGTNIEAPLDTIKQAVAEVLANMQIKNVFDVQGDSNRLFKVVQKESNIYYDQHGYSAFKG